MIIGNSVMEIIGRLPLPISRSSAAFQDLEWPDGDAPYGRVLQTIIVIGVLFLLCVWLRWLKGVFKD